MNSFTLRHLRAWLMDHVVEDKQSYLEEIIVNYVDENPGVLETHSWPEIRRLAETEYV